jgi:glycosyltransferase involved in cell wall biosynthesis
LSTTVSIIICTRNQADSLKRTLTSIGKAIVPRGWTVELLVVDNGSTDSTPAVVASMTLPNLPIRYIQEPRKGKAYAYNTGIAAAHGRMFLFTDDDVRVPVGWIDGMCRPMLDRGADAVAGGVEFPPDLTSALTQPPFSLRRSLFASTEELNREAPARMVGANMAFHRHVLDQVPGFDVELGPGALGFYDETLFSWQLLAAGYTLVGAFDVVVEHHFDRARLTSEGLIGIARKMGRSHAFVFHHWSHKKSRLAFPRMVLTHLCRKWMQCSDRIRGKTACVVSIHTLQVEQDLAFYSEYIAQRRRPHKYPPPNHAPKISRAPACLLSNGDQSPDVSVSIIICTRNRAESLKLTLASIGKAIVPPGWKAELLIVDNGSTDHTPAVVSAAHCRNVVMRYVNEPEIGLCHARNTGLKEASGTIFLFTDDDVRVPSNWIEGMCRPILDGKADAIAGGVVFPPAIAVALSQPLFSSRRSWFASTDELNPEAPTRMVGANMAFHRHVLDRVPGFDVELGAGALGFYDETLFSWQLLAAGYNLVGSFDVAVEHHFDPGRLTIDVLFGMARKMGRSHAFVFHHWSHKKSRLVLPRLVLTHLYRKWMRCSDRIKVKTASLASLHALQVEQDLAFYREYTVQRRRRYKYPSRGLAPSHAHARSSPPGN